MEERKLCNNDFLGFKQKTEIQKSASRRMFQKAHITAQIKKLRKVALLLATSKDRTTWSFSHNTSSNLRVSFHPEIQELHHVHVYCSRNRTRNFCNMSQMVLDHTFRISNLQSWKASMNRLRKFTLFLLFLSAPLTNKIFVISLFLPWIAMCNGVQPS